MSDQLQRFLFENYEIRGEIAKANNSFHAVIQNHKYPEEIANLLGELLVATSLLTATLKFNGTITVQLEGKGALKLAVINANQDLELKGVARYDGDTKGLTFKELVGNGHLMITISPDEGERYQGIVSLERENLSLCLEDYFQKSEQLSTKIILHASMGETPKAAGLLLQTLPAKTEDHEKDFQHLCALASTVLDDELYNLASEEVLYRLFHQEEVKIFEPDNISFKCGCSRDRCLSSLASIEPEEIKSMLQEAGSIDMHCEYCGTDHHFEADDLQLLLTNEPKIKH